MSLGLNFGLNNIDAISKNASKYRSNIKLTKNMPQHGVDGWYENIFDSREPYGSDQLEYSNRVRDMFTNDVHYEPSKGLLHVKNGSTYMAGYFVAPNINDISIALKEIKSTPGHSKYKIVSNQDISNIIVNVLPDLSLVQAASQFNALEMANPSARPSDGLRAYEYDRTQGPAVALTAITGTWVRNYYLPSILGSQFNGLHDLRMETHNGYLLWHDKPSHFNDKFQDMFSHIRVPYSLYTQVVGIHSKVYQGAFSHHHQNKLSHQAYTASIPVDQYGNGGDKIKQCINVYWNLYAQYISIIGMAIILHHYDVKYHNKVAIPPHVDLTFIGSGVFGNPIELVISAVFDAMLVYQNYNVKYIIQAVGAGSAINNILKSPKGQIDYNMLKVYSDSVKHIYPVNVSKHIKPYGSNQHGLNTNSNMMMSLASPKQNSNVSFAPPSLLTNTRPISPVRQSSPPRSAMRSTAGNTFNTLNGMPSMAAPLTRPFTTNNMNSSITSPSPIATPSTSMAPKVMANPFPTFMTAPITSPVVPTTFNNTSQKKVIPSPFINIAADKKQGPAYGMSNSGTARPYKTIARPSGPILNPLEDRAVTATPSYGMSNVSQSTRSVSPPKSVVRQNVVRKPLPAMNMRLVAIQDLNSNEHKFYLPKGYQHEMFDKVWSTSSNNNVEFKSYDDNGQAVIATIHQRLLDNGTNLVWYHPPAAGSVNRTNYLIDYNDLKSYGISNVARNNDGWSYVLYKDDKAITSYPPS